MAAERRRRLFEKKQLKFEIQTGHPLALLQELSSTRRKKPLSSICFHSHLYSSDPRERILLFFSRWVSFKMNDLMTKSFLSYVDLKKQAMKDMEADYSAGDGIGELDPSDERNLSKFFEEVCQIKTEMEEISNLLVELKSLNEEAKSIFSAKILRGLRDRMDSNMVSILRKSKNVKSRLESFDRSNLKNRTISEAYKEGSPVDRTRISVTNGMRVRLRELMNDFQFLRERILGDHKEDLRRTYYTATGEQLSDEMVEKIAMGGERIELFQDKKDSRESNDAILDIQRSLNKLHQIFLDMAVLVENQGEKLDDIEENVASAGSFINGGTNSLYYANQTKKESKKWAYWVAAVGLIIILVCFIATLVS